MTKDEKNRKIAEWLGWKPNESRTRWHSPACQRDEDSCSGVIPDFYADEAANALVLEKLADTSLCGNFCLLHSNQNDLWWTTYHIGWGLKEAEVTHADRKTAICEAALKLIEAGNG